MRLLKIEVSAELVTQLLTAGFRSDPGCVCIKGLPAESVLVGAQFDGRNLSLNYTHPTFPEVPTGGVIPAADATYMSFATVDRAKDAVKNARPIQAGIDYGFPIRESTKLAWSEWVLKQSTDTPTVVE